MTDHLKISKILILCFAAAAVISAACAWFCTRILTPGTIELKMDAMLEHAGNIKIYYLGKNGQNRKLSNLKFFPQNRCGP